MKVIPQFDQFTQYDLEIDDITQEMLPTTTTEAKQIFISPFKQTVYGYLEADVPGFLTFTLWETTELLVEPGMPHVILDSTLTEVTGYILPSGTYYIRFNVPTDMYFYFTFRAISSLKHDELVPVSIEPGIIYWAYSPSSSETDVYTYTPTENQYLYIHFLKYAYLNISIKNSSDVIIQASTTSTSDFDRQYFYLRAGETYTISFTMLSGDYSFMLLAQPYEDAGDTAILAENIDVSKFNHEIEATILDHLDEDYFSIVITEETAIYITFSSSFVGLYASTDFETALTTDSTTVVLTPGTYYLHFVNTIHTDYSFIIHTIAG